MRYLQIQIVIEKEPEDEGYFAHSPALPGCFSNGRTVEEARKNMREAVELHLEGVVARGEPLPPAPAAVIVEDLTVAVPA